jgi:hypothetical protein
MTKPLPGEDLGVSWTSLSVQPTTASCESTAEMGAAYVFGFQLYKQDGDRLTQTQRARRWNKNVEVHAKLT